MCFVRLALDAAATKKSMTEHPYLGVIPGVHTRKAHRQISYDKNRADTCTPLDSAAPKVAKSNGPVLAPAVGSHAIAFTVNGVAHTASAGADLDAHTTLASYLREKLNLTGTKIGCNEGGCGACTVMIGRQDSTTGQITTTLANSCLRPLFSLDGAHVITTEGLGSSAKGFGPVQRKIAECNGTQCGYCTPGFTLAMSGLLATAEQPTAEEVETRFQGNLCRCTGYRSIYEAMHTFAATDEHGQPTAEARALCAEAGADIEDLLREGVRSQCALKGCGNSAASRGCAADGKGGCPNVDADGESGCTNLESATEGGHSTAGACCQHGHEARAHAEPCAPPAAVADGASKMAANGVSWIEPTSLDGALEAVKTCVAAGEAYRLVVGSTSPGVAKYYPSVASDAPTSFIHIARLAELTQVQISASEITFGAAVTLSSVIDSLRTALKGDASASRPARKGAELAGGIGPIGEANLQSAIRHLSLVAHYQVRDVASWAGNLLLAKQHPCASVVRTRQLAERPERHVGRASSLQVLPFGRGARLWYRGRHSLGATRDERRGVDDDRARLPRPSVCASRGPRYPQRHFPARELGDDRPRLVQGDEPPRQLARARQRRLPPRAVRRRRRRGRRGLCLADDRLRKRPRRQHLAGPAALP